MAAPRSMGRAKYIFIGLWTQMSFFPFTSAWAQSMEAGTPGGGFSLQRDGIKIVLILALAYILVRLFNSLRKKRTSGTVGTPFPTPRSDTRDAASTQSPTPSSDMPGASSRTPSPEKTDASTPPLSREQRAKAAWEMLMQPSAAADVLKRNTLAPGAEPHEEGGELIQGAKLLYARIYEDINTEDTKDLEDFATPEIAEALEKANRERKASGIQGRYDLLFVEAREVSLDDTSAEIRFSTKMRLPGQETSKEVTENWKFIRNSPSDLWRLSAMDGSPLLDSRTA